MVMSITNRLGKVDFVGVVLDVQLNFELLEFAVLAKHLASYPGPPFNFARGGPGVRKYVM